jgi:hypothetical protein
VESFEAYYPRICPGGLNEDYDKCVRIAVSRVCSRDLTWSANISACHSLSRFKDVVSHEILKLTTSVRSFDMDPHRTLVSVFSLSFM